MNRKLRCLLFVLGLASLVAFLITDNHPKPLILVGLLPMWIVAWAGMLLQFYKKGTPLPTAWAWVNREKQPDSYLGLYSFVFFFGACVIVAIASVLVTTFARR